MELETNSEEPPKKYLKYDTLNRELAIQEVKNGNLSINQASQKYNVPSSTVHDYVKGKHSENPKKRGPKNILKPDEEQKIAEWLIQCSEMGDPRNEDDLKVTAAKMRNVRLGDDTPSFKNDFPSSFWVKNFEKRNQQISIRKPENVARAAANITEGHIRNFFEHVYCYLSENNLLDILERPEAIVNLDESGFEYNPSLKRAYAARGSKNVVRVDNGRGKQATTVTFAFTASGEVLSPQIVFKNSFSRMGEAAYAASRSKTSIIFSQTESGWQTMESFEAYLKLLIDELAHIPKPILIMYDNHPSHINMELFKYCADRNIHIITFPPNTTSILQMADVSVFGPSKTAWKKEILAWERENHDQMLDEVQFIPLLKKMMDKAMTKENIISGFRATGIYPFNVEQVNFNKCLGFVSNPIINGKYQPMPKIIIHRHEVKKPGSDQFVDIKGKSSHNIFI